MHATSVLMFSCMQITDSIMYRINLLMLSNPYGKKGMEKNNLNSMEIEKSQIPGS